MLEVTAPTEPEIHDHRSHSTTDETNTRSISDQWHGFHPPEKISVTHPWISRYYQSAILDNSQGSGLMSTTDKETYGNNNGPVAFRIGNGGAGWTGVLRVLSEKFIEQDGNDFKIAWVVNHSRRSQTALLADVVQVALTYEQDMEELAAREGWCRRAAAPAFWDHFILVGPVGNPAGISPGASSKQALQRIAEHSALFHTRGDGSATHEKEQKLGREAGIDWPSASWLRKCGSSPYSALEMAQEEGAYLLTDRATFLTAKKDGVIPDLVVYAERETALLNPCTALINTKVPDSPGQSLAVRFAEWLREEEAQTMLRMYGRDWRHGMPLFTDAGQKDFAEDELLSGKAL